MFCFPYVSAGISAFVPPSTLLASSAVSRSSAISMMARAPPKGKPAAKKPASKKPVAKKAPAKKAPAKKPATKKANSKANPDGSEGTRFWAPGFGSGPLPNGGQIFFSEWTTVKQLFALEAVGGAQGNVKSPGGLEGTGFGKGFGLPFLGD